MNNVNTCLYIDLGSDIDEIIIENCKLWAMEKYYIGRTMQDVPEIDGLVYIKNNSKNSKENKLNKFLKCKIIEISDYDLIAEFVK